MCHEYFSLEGEVADTFRRLPVVIETTAPAKLTDYSVCHESR